MKRPVLTKCCVVILALAAAVLLAAAVAGAASVEFVTDADKVKVGDGDGSGAWAPGQRSVAAFGDNIYTVWTYDGAVWFAKSEDGGRFWHRSVVLGTTSWAGPVIDVNPSSGTIHVVWGAEYDTYPNDGIRYTRSIDGGDSWSASTDIRGTASYKYDANVAADAAGRVHVVWTASGNIYHTLSTDGGLTWNTPSAIIVGDSAQEPVIGADGNGDVYMAWRAGSAVHYSKSTTQDGSTWGTIIDLSSGVSYGYPSLDVNSSGLVAVGWQSNATPAGVYVAASPDGETSWQFASVVNEADRNFELSVAVGEDGNIQTAWRSWQGVEFARSKNGGITWGNVTLVATDAAYPSLAVDGGGKAVGAWGDSVAGVRAFTREK